MTTWGKEMGLSETRGHTSRLFYRLFPPRNSRPGHWLSMHTASTESPVAVSCEKERSACSRLQTPTSETLCIPKICRVSLLFCGSLLLFFQTDLTVCFLRILVLIFIPLSINVCSKCFWTVYLSFNETDAPECNPLLTRNWQEGRSVSITEFYSLC